MVFHELWRACVLAFVGLIFWQLYDIRQILTRAEHINERVNANITEQLAKPLSVTINQDKPIGVAIDNDVLNMKVQK